MKKFSVKWWLLSASAVLMTLWVFVVFTFLFIGRELLLLGNLINLANRSKEAPVWVQNWAHRIQKIYEDYLEL